MKIILYSSSDEPLVINNIDLILQTMGIASSKDRDLLKKKIKEIKTGMEKEKKIQEKERKAKEKEQKKQLQKKK
jgi:hypothetical protein